MTYVRFELIDVLSLGQIAFRVESNRVDPTVRITTPPHNTSI